MKKAEITDRRYPIGKFEYGRKYKIDDTRKHIRHLARVPKALKKLVKKLDHDELDTPYRKGGWTVRQVIHHLADSHMNAYIRTKLAVTEQTPIIKPYEEQLWAETEDGKRGSVKMSIKLISALHRRWVEFLASLSEDDLERGYFHPASGRVVLMQEAIALYVWHSQHHLAHIRLVVDGETEKSKKTEKTTKAPKAKSAKEKEDAPAEAPAVKKRVRRTAEQIAADNAAKTALAAEAKKAKEAKAAEKAAKPPLDRAAILAKARAARAANLAATEPKELVKPVKEKKAAAEKTAKPPVDRAAIMAKARAARAANLAATEPKETKPEQESKAAAEPSKRVRRTAEQIAADNAAKAAKQAASGAPKRSGMSPEHMAKIREARMAKRAEAIAAGLIPPPKPKVEKDPNAPKLDRAVIMEKARAARMANIAAKKAEADKA